MFVNFDECFDVVCIGGWDVMLGVFIVLEICFLPISEPFDRFSFVPVFLFDLLSGML